MIGKDVINGRRQYSCDGCGVTAQFKSYDEARSSGGWGISYERINCYCPACAPKYRHVGRAGFKIIKGQQISII